MTDTVGRFRDIYVSLEEYDLATSCLLPVRRGTTKEGPRKGTTCKETQSEDVRIPETAPVHVALN